MTTNRTTPDDHRRPLPGDEHRYLHLEGPS